MVRISNILVAIFSIVSLITSIAILGGSLWVHHHTICERLAEKPLILMGFFLLIASILGMVGACFRITILLWIYLFMLLVLIVGLIGFSLFVIAVTNKGVGEAVSGLGFKEYRLGDYSHWLRKYVRNVNHWAEIKTCLVESRVCMNFKNGYKYNSSDFFHLNLSPTQSGCCKPPAYCGFVFKNATFWEMPRGGPKVGDGDCRTWSNDQKRLCYSCNSCRAGVLANVMAEWRKLVILNCLLVSIFVVFYSVGCYALRRNKHDNAYERHRSTPY